MHMGNRNFFTSNHFSKPSTVTVTSIPITILASSGSPIRANQIVNAIRIAYNIAIKSVDLFDVEIFGKEVQEMRLLPEKSVDGASLTRRRRSKKKTVQR